MNPAPHDVVLRALEHLLAWPELARSPQLASFLEYIVHRTLEGQDQSIKAYSIAVDVFGRPANFDPQSDPIVRVQARRLRSLLRDYYADQGKGEPLQIKLPTGRYIPEFVQKDPVLEFKPLRVPEPSSPRSVISPRSSRYVLLAILTFGVALTALAGGYWFEKAQPRLAVLEQPSISIVEFANLAGVSGEAPIVSGLAVELVTDLEQFENIDVRYAGALPQEQTSLDVGTDYVLTGVARQDGDIVQYSALLTDAASTTVVWNKTIPIPRELANDTAIRDELSRLFSLVLGSPRGPLHAHARNWANAPEIEGQPTNLYLCRVMFDLYRETREHTRADRSRQCIEQLPEPERSSPIAAAIAAILSAKTAQRDGDQTQEEVWEQALREIDRAIEASPVSSFIWEQHARLREAMGQTTLALADYSSALQLNPANSDALAAYGNLLVLTSAAEEARPMLRVALEDAPDPPAWYFGGPTLLALSDGNYTRAVHFAERFVQSDRELGPVLAVVAAQGTADGAVVNRYLPQIMDTAAFHKSGIMPRLRETISDPALLQLISEGLTAAGLPANALEQAF